MPIVASPTQQAWIRVPPPRLKTKHIELSRHEAMKGPLAYFSCQSVPVKKMGICPRYDLDGYDEDADEDEEGQRQGQGQGDRKRGKRTVSAPAHAQAGPRRTGAGAGNGNGKRGARGKIEYDDLEEEEEYAQTRAQRRSPPSRERSRPPPPTSRAQPQQRAQSAYWTGPSKRAVPPRAYGGGSAGGSVVSRSWANATSALDLG